MTIEKELVSIGTSLKEINANLKMMVQLRQPKKKRPWKPYEFSSTRKL